MEENAEEASAVSCKGKWKGHGDEPCQTEITSGDVPEPGAQGKGKSGNSKPSKGKKPKKDS
jgi:hypothetical protein